MILTEAMIERVFKFIRINFLSVFFLSVQFVMTRLVFSRFSDFGGNTGLF